MRTLLLFVVLLALALTAGRAAAIDSRSTSEATKVRSLLLTQTRLFNRSQWRPMYRTLAPRVRAQCSYPRFVREVKVMRTLAGRMTVRNIHVRVAGRHASATYTQLAGGDIVGVMTAKNPDRFVRIGKRWFDDLDAGSPCRGTPVT